nr:DUF3426 domain-containing protein [Massilia sp. DJPM01]
METAFVPVWLRQQPAPAPEPEPVPEPEPELVHVPEPEPVAEPEPEPEPEPAPRTKPFIPLSIATFVEPEDMYDEPYAAPYVEPEPPPAVWRGKSKTPWPTIDIDGHDQAPPASGPAPFPVDMPIDEEIVAIAPPEDLSEPEFGELSFDEPVLDLTYPSAPVRDPNARIEPVFFAPEPKAPVFVEPVFVEPVFVEPVRVEPAFAEPARFELPAKPAFDEPIHAVVAEPAKVLLPLVAPAFDEPVHTEPELAEPAQFLPPLVEPAFDEPVHAEPELAEAAQFLPPLAEAAFDEPVHAEPELAEPAGFLPPLVEPAVDEPLHVEPELAEPAQFLPPPVEPAFDEPVHVEPELAEPAQFQPPLVEPSFNEPLHVEPELAEPAGFLPPRVEPAFNEPVHIEPQLDEPAYDEPVRVEPRAARPARFQPVVEHAYDEPGHTVLVLSYAEETTPHDDEARSDALLNPNTEPLVRDLEHAPLPLLRQSSGDNPAPKPSKKAARKPAAPPPPPPAEVVPEPEHDEPDFLRRSRELEEKQGSRRIAMLLGSVLLAILLVGQGVTTFRNILVAKFPAIKPVLVSACATLGCKLELPAQIDSLSIETGELQSLGANAFTLSTLLRNQSDLTQAWPNIELALTDGNDKTLLRRVVVPAEYLPKGTVTAKGFAARSEQAVKLTFEVKQIKASGYRIAIFYP